MAANLATSMFSHPSAGRLDDLADQILAQRVGNLHGLAVTDFGEKLSILILKRRLIEVRHLAHHYHVCPS
jgi:hypothetical protein